MGFQRLRKPDAVWQWSFSSWTRDSLLLKSRPPNSKAITKTFMCNYCTISLDHFSPPVIGSHILSLLQCLYFATNYGCSCVRRHRAILARSLVCAAHLLRHCSGGWVRTARQTEPPHSFERRESSQATDGPWNQVQGRLLCLRFACLLTEVRQDAQLNNSQFTVPKNPVLQSRKNDNVRSGKQTFETSLHQQFVVTRRGRRRQSQHASQSSSEEGSLLQMPRSDGWSPSRKPTGTLCAYWPEIPN